MANISNLPALISVHLYCHRVYLTVFKYFSVNSKLGAPYRRPGLRCYSHTRDLLRYIVVYSLK